MLLVALISGCEPPPIDFLEVKRLDEPLTESDVQTFLRIVDSLPGDRLPAIPSVFSSAPSWSAGRTLPVSELVYEEQQAVAQLWDVDRLAHQIGRVRPLQRALARERMTTEQFVGLTLSIGASLSRNALRENQDLRKIAQAGRIEVEKLREDQRSFSTLSEDDRYVILLRAIWITRRDRASRLVNIPEANVELVRRHYDKLAAIFPSEFVANPFDGVADTLEERGVPFEEQDRSGRDDQIEWRRADAIVGHDKPEGSDAR